MSSTVKRVLVAVCCAGSLALALSFFLPIAHDLTYFSAQGEQLGFFGHLTPGPTAIRVATNEYVWQDMNGIEPCIYFLPLLLLLLRSIRNLRIRRWVTAVTPPVAMYLFVILIAIVSLADFGLFVESAYGGYVALVALGGFILAATGLALPGWCRWAGRIVARLRPPTARLSVLS